MEQIDLNTLERHFDMTLPVAYRDAVTRENRSNGDAAQEFLTDPTDILVLNLELRWLWNSRGDEPWPSKLLAIGEDVCGNFFAIDTTAGSGEVLIFDHERSQFDVESKSITEYVHRLRANQSRREFKFGWGRRKQKSPDKVVELIICRTEDPRHSVLDPITLADWSTFVEQDDALVLKNCRVGINPFTKEEVRFESPGLSTLLTAAGDEIFHFYFGRVVVKNPSATAVAKASEAARFLQARLLN